MTVDPLSEPESLRIRMVSEARQTFGNRAASQLWVKLHLPLVPAMLEEPAQADLFRPMKTIEQK